MSSRGGRSDVDKICSPLPLWQKSLQCLSFVFHVRVLCHLTVSVQRVSLINPLTFDALSLHSSLLTLRIGGRYMYPKIFVISDETAECNNASLSKMYFT